MMRQIWRVMAASGGMRRALALAVLVVMAGVGLLMLSGWFISAAAIAGAGAVFDVFRPAASVRGLALIRTAARYGERVLGHDATLRAVAGLRGAVLAGLGALPWDAMQRLRRGSALSRVVADTDLLDGLPLRIVLPAAAGAAVLAASFALMVWLADWQVAAWVVGCHLIATLSAGLWGLRRSGQVAAGAVAAERAFRSHALDLIAARDDLAVYGQLDAQIDRAMQAEARACRANAVLEGTERRVAVAQELARLAAMAGALVLGAQAQLSPAIIAMCFFAGLALAEATAPMRRAVADWGRIRDAASRVAPMLGRPAARIAPPQPALPLIVDGIRIGPGQMLGLQGRSGAGKSTLLSQIAGLIPPTAPITLAGRPVQDWSEAELRAVLTLVPQRPALIAGSLRDNLALADPAATDARMQRLLDAMRLPYPLDHRLGDGGQGLSGGEARRLAIARALLRKPLILLLDEPTEGLDAALADVIMREILLISCDISVVAASHRPCDLRAASAVIRLE